MTLQSVDSGRGSNEVRSRMLLNGDSAKQILTFNSAILKSCDSIICSCVAFSGLS